MVTYKQELPPPGGFEEIQWERRLPKKTRGSVLMAGYVAFSTVMYLIWRREQNRQNLFELDLFDCRIATEPFLFAERDRMMLKQVRQNRDEENELMKDVPQWKTGTLWGIPVYYNKRGRWFEPTREELWAHASKKDMMQARDWLWNNHLPR